MSQESFEYKIDALLEKEADFCKALINLIYSSDCELKDLALDDNTQNRIITKLNQNEEAWEALLSVLSPSYISDERRQGTVLCLFPGYNS